MAAGTPKLKRSRTYSIDDKFDAKGKRVYQVLCSDKTNDDADTAVAAVVAAGHGLGSPWSLLQPGLVVVEISCDESSSAPLTGTLYDVTCDYAIKKIESSQQEEDPVDRPMVIRLSFDGTEETIYQAKDDLPIVEDFDGADVNIASTWHWGKSIVNSAGIAFDNQLTEIFRDPVITITKNVDTNDFASIWILLAANINTVNVAAFNIVYRGIALTIAAKTCWLSECTSEPRVETIKSTGEERQFEEVTLTFRIRADGWLRKVLDRGKAGFLADDPSATSAPDPIRDQNGDPVQEAVLLDGKGSQVGSPMALTKGAFIKFRTKEYGAHGTLLNALS